MKTVYSHTIACHVLRTQIQFLYDRISMKKVVYLINDSNLFSFVSLISKCDMKYIALFGLTLVSKISQVR